MATGHSTSSSPSATAAATASTAVRAPFERQWREAARVAGKPGDPPLVVHVIHRLDTGGLENGLVNLINRMPDHRFRHAIVCMTSYTDFRKRIQRPNVAVFALDKPEGNSPRTLYRLWRLLRRLKPAIVHSRNLATLEAAVPALLAGVGARVHGEHGRDIGDLDGNNVRQQRIRKLIRPFVHQYIALSKDLESYLLDKIDVEPTRIAQFYNGVDTDRFHPAHDGSARDALPAGFAPHGTFVIGTVGRLQPVKDQLTLARAFVRLREIAPHYAPHLRLAIVGAGPLLIEVAQILDKAGAGAYAWLPGERDDVPAIMRSFDLFVLPSLAEGISNTILEAMATGLPIVATAVGGNPELIDAGATGALVPRADPDAMARALLGYVSDPVECRRQGRAARAKAEREFSMSAMVERYLALYARMLHGGSH